MLPEVEKQWQKKQRFHDELECEWNLRSNAEIVLGLERFSESIRKRTDVFESIHGGKSFALVNRVCKEKCKEKI